MKSLHKIILFALLPLMGACSGMLDIEPHSAVSPTVVGSDDIEALRIGMYNKVQEGPTCLSAINAENQQIIKQTPNFIPKNVKLGVFILFKTNHIRSENNLIKNRTNEKNNQFIFRKISYLCSK